MDAADTPWTFFLGRVRRVNAEPQCPAATSCQTIARKPHGVGKPHGMVHARIPHTVAEPHGKKILVDFQSREADLQAVLPLDKS